MGCTEPRSSRCQRDYPESPAAPVLLALVLLIVVLVLALSAEAALEQSLDDPNAIDIRSSIVEALGLQRIPDPAKANVSQIEYERAHKEYLTRLRRSTEGDTRQRRLFTMYGTDKRTREGIALSFPLTVDESENVLVESASLRLLLDHNEEPRSGSVQVRLYRRRAAGTRRWLVDHRTIEEPEFLRRRWLEFDLTDVVTATLDSNAPLYLTLQVVHEDASHLRGFIVASAALNVHALYPESWAPRRRRSIGSLAREQLMSLHRGRRTECHGDAKRCCRHRMAVTFKDLEGFDFIIQPKTFDAGYCKGRCPPRYNPAHHHALLQSLIWKEDRKKAPRPCCAPSKLAELEILYFDENDATKLKVSNWKDMRVLECACS
ncbi:PREDICTED: bone morphogenetic protein 6 [Ceratosolen solmsi marchali]|uniref:Bone morphogenetic protein 6 n=1 Tax=Ceratosolen solmsi marchali TaxID=326594 RepID=A0AAJ6YH21_9HYME|nr:PREDICTED: bone morphogenetic protein 6 [Ceratosolen solmsi marchali]